MKRIVFTLLALSTFLLYDNVFAINEDYFDSLTYDEYANWYEKDNSNYNNENLAIKDTIEEFLEPLKVLSLEDINNYNYIVYNRFPTNTTKNLTKPAQKAKNQLSNPYTNAMIKNG